jgi:hypothetical protein
MLCATPPPTTACIPCIHPFEYILELAYVGTTGTNNRTALEEALDRILDKGLSQPNCDLCCPDCEGVYVLASVETFLKFAEAVGITTSAAVPASPDLLVGTFPTNPEVCCSNVYASTETYLKYAEAVGITPPTAVIASPLSATIDVNQGEYVTPCCNGFDECMDELVCWITETSSNSANAIGILQDKGIVEYGQIQNNCTGAVSSSICKLVDLFKRYVNVKLAGSRSEVIDRLIDKGIVISCDSNGEIHMASVETWLKYAEAMGLTQSAVPPALGETTTTTTVA